MSIQAGGLLHRGRRLEYLTLGWNLVGAAILVVAAIAAGSVALAGFGLDSLIEIGASAVVLWQLAGSTQATRVHPAMRLIGVGFVLLVIYLIAQVAYTVATGGRPEPSPLGIVWTALTVLVMLALAAGKTRTDALLAGSCCSGWSSRPPSTGGGAEPLAGLVIVHYGIREAHATVRPIEVTKVPFRPVGLGRTSRPTVRTHAIHPV